MVEKNSESPTVVIQLRGFFLYRVIKVYIKYNEMYLQTNIIMIYLTHKLTKEAL